MTRFGAWYVPKGDEKKQKIVLYDHEDKAREAIQGKLPELEHGDNLTLIRARCDDQGRIVSSQFEILQVWSV